MIVTAAQAEGPFVVYGDYPPCPADTDGDGDCAACYRRPEAHGIVPPSKWADLDRHCEECGGTRW